MRDLGGCTVSGNPEGTGTDAGVAVGTREAATRRAGALIQSGAVAKALPLLEALCAEDPADNATHGLYAEAIHLAHGR
jgi:thioredoxin-like negative regulator of GroEL